MPPSSVKEERVLHCAVVLNAHSMRRLLPWAVSGTFPSIPFPFPCLPVCRSYARVVMMLIPVHMPVHMLMLWW